MNERSKWDVYTFQRLHIPIGTTRKVTSILDEGMDFEPILADDDEVDQAQPADGAATDAPLAPADDPAVDDAAADNEADDIVADAAKEPVLKDGATASDSSEHSSAQTSPAPETPAATPVHSPPPPTTVPSPPKTSDQQPASTLPTFSTQSFSSSTELRQILQALNTIQVNQVAAQSQMTQLITAQTTIQEQLDAQRVEIAAIKGESEQAKATSSAGPSAPAPERVPDLIDHLVLDTLKSISGLLDNVFTYEAIDHGFKEVLKRLRKELSEGLLQGFASLQEQVLEKIAQGGVDTPGKARLARA